MKINIQEIKILGLHGDIDITIILNENKLILVAENGAGKTTIVNIIFFFLSRQWGKLNDYNFKSIIALINDKQFIYKKEDSKNFNSRIFHKYPNRFQPIIEHVLSNYSPSELRSHNTIERLISQFDIPSGLLRDIQRMIEIEGFENENKELRELDENLKKIFRNYQFVYLPTYRRIEKDLKNIFPDLIESMDKYEYRRRKRLSMEQPDYLELVEFGMEDVKHLVDNRCQELKNYFYNNLSKKITGSYLEDILNKKYKDFDTKQLKKVTDDILNYILKRLDDTLLSQEGKTSLKEFVTFIKNEKSQANDENRINAYFVWKLFQIYQDQQKEEQDINKFVNICNNYLGRNKRFLYDNDNFKIVIELLDKEGNKKNELQYQDLSSGEKQIVSLFSHLCLSKKKFYIIIDEPELSISVPWQEKLLPDILSTTDCLGILAVTHSPFIFNNALKGFAHSLEEFTN